MRHITIWLAGLLVSISAVVAQPTFPTNVVVTLVQRGNVSMAWDRAPSHTNVVFTVLVGVAPGVYNLRDEAGTNTIHTVTNLNPGTYYFAVIARNPAGLESDPSNEVSATISKPVVVPTLRTVQIDAILEAAVFVNGPWSTVSVYPRVTVLADAEKKFYRVRLLTSDGPRITQ